MTGTVLNVDRSKFPASYALENYYGAAKHVKQDFMESSVNRRV